MQRFAALALVLVGALLTSADRAKSEASQFRDEPITCGAMLAWSTCKATFDGWTLTIMSTAPDGRKAEATYRTCVPDHDMIRCGSGIWRQGQLRGELQPVVIGLRNGKPFAQRP
jgi:hypothetical protein